MTFPASSVSVNSSVEPDMIAWDVGQERQSDEKHVVVLLTEARWHESGVVFGQGRSFPKFG